MVAPLSALRSRRLAPVVLAVTVALGACSSDGTGRSVSTGTSAPAATSTSTTVASPTTAPPTSVARPAVAKSALQAAIDAAASGRRVPVSVVALDLTTGERAEHLGRRVVLSASLYKLFVAHELFRRIGTGEVRRDQPSGDGTHTVDECLRLMIVISDDGCGVAGLNMVGRGAMDPSLHRDGFPGTYLESPQRTTAADVVEFLRRERAGDSELYGLLRQQQVNDRIPPALPPGTPIAHKTGDRTGWAHDAGVITTPRGEVIVAVLTGAWPSPCCHEERIGALEREAFALIGAVARRVYDVVAAG
jgi:beta-lactamase class A